MDQFSQSAPTWSVNDILTKAQQYNIAALSITDHNTIEAYTEIEDRQDIYQGKIVRGVEIACIVNNSRIEILGYAFQNPSILDDWLREKYSPEKIKLFRKGEYERLLEKLHEYGVINNCNPVYANQIYLPHTAVFNEIKKYESNAVFMSEKEWNDFVVFFRTATTNHQSKFFIDYTGLLPSVNEAAEIIKKADGKVFLAHVYSYGIDNHIEFINTLRNSIVLDGIEVFYTNYTKEQTQTLCSYCMYNKLYMSGGSDSHGDKGSIKIGTGYGNLVVPDSIIEAWA